MDHLSFKPCLADPDVWMHPATKSNGVKHWEYALVLYTDDTLVISERGEDILRQEIGRYFELKEESIGPPAIYLGGPMRKVTLKSGTKAWPFGSSQYVHAAVANVEAKLTLRNASLPTRVNTPLKSGYRPKIDITPELNPKDALHYYHSLIGILRWIVELGRVNICCEISMMSSHLALPRQGHLKQIYHGFAYLKKYHNAQMVFNPSYSNIDLPLFEQKDWTMTEFGLTTKEDLPPKMPQPPHGFHL
jgi:hypothetical protein